MHSPDHDPILDYRHCWICHAALSAAWAKLADIPLGPRDVDTLIRKIRQLAAGIETA